MNWTEAEVAAYLMRYGQRKTKTPADAAVRSPYSQPAKFPKVKKPDASKEANPVYRIHVHSKRRRLTDSDGVSVKAAIDGLVEGGLLIDDSPDVVSEVTTSQEKSEIEETVLEVWQIGGSSSRRFQKGRG